MPWPGCLFAKLKFQRYVYFNMSCMRIERKISKTMRGGGGGGGVLLALMYIWFRSQFWENISEFLKAKRQGRGNLDE